jgi:hypothetical protein
MASTISNVTLNVQVTEAVVLNNEDHGSTNSVAITGVNEVSKRIMSLTANTDITLATFSTVPAAGQFITSSVKYVRITNLDDANSVNINLGGAAENVWIYLDWGRSLILSQPSSAIDAVASGTVATASLADVTTITGNTANASNTIDVEVFIASS